MDAGLADSDSFCLVTDRECGAESRFRDLGIRVKRACFEGDEDFSRVAAAYFSARGVDVVFLFYSRLVGPALYASIPTINVHPSLLPMFRGFNAIDKTLAAGARFQGVTAHIVDSGADTGGILVQSSVPLPLGADMEHARRTAYLQQVLVCLVCIDLLDSGRLRIAPEIQECVWEGDVPVAPSVSPTFAGEKIATAYRRFLAGEQYRGICADPLPRTAETE